MKAMTKLVALLLAMVLVLGFAPALAASDAYIGADGKAYATTVGFRGDPNSPTMSIENGRVFVRGIPDGCELCVYVDIPFPNFKNVYKYEGRSNAGGSFSFALPPEKGVYVVTVSAGNDYELSFSTEVSPSSSRFVLHDAYAEQKALADAERTDPGVLHQYLLPNFQEADGGFYSYNPEITVKAAEITKGVVGDYAKALAIYKWVAGNMLYDTKAESPHASAGVAIRTMTGVCDAFANLTVALLRAAGIPAKKVASERHAWTKAYRDGRWVILDTTNAGLGEKSPNQPVRENYFDPPFETYSAGHKKDPTSNNNREPTYEQAPADPWLYADGWAKPAIDSAWAKGFLRGQGLWGMDRVFNDGSIKNSKFYGGHARDGEGGFFTDYGEMSLPSTDYTRPITRAQFAALTLRWLAWYEGFYSRDGDMMENAIEAMLEARGVARDPSKFTDCKDPDVLAAAALGLASGSNGRFLPDKTMTRQEAAALTLNACKLAGLYDGPAEPAPFTDRGAIDAWARPSVDFFYAKGFVSGTGGRFVPLGTFSKEQAVVILNSIEPPAKG
jgi:transglutaminase-like putative cysteine protease